MSADGDVRMLLDKYPDTVARLALSVRAWIHRNVPAVTEEADVSAKLIGFNIGPGYKGVACTVMLSQKGVKLGLSGGASLPDPNGLLEGTGKVHKYVVVRSAADLDDPAVAALLAGAVSNAKRKLGTA